MALFMGIDIGTSSVKTLVTDEHGRTLAVAQQEYDVEKPHPLYHEQDMNIIWEKTKTTIQKVLENITAYELKGISFSGQMHSLVMIDKNGKVLEKAILWSDQRSAAETQSVYKKYGEDNFKSITLNALGTGFLWTSLLWVKNNRKNIYEKIDKVLLPKDYIRYLMCGEIGTDYSDASATLIFDVQKQEWAWQIIDTFGVPRTLFPECHESYEIAGKVTEHCAKETGLPKGIPVVYGGGDSIMQQLGNGVFGKNSPLIANIGTSCSVNCAAEQAIYDHKYRVNTFCHAQKNLWFFMGANLCGGSALKWLKNKILFMNSYNEMSALAEEVPSGSDGLLFLPYLNGTRSPVNDPDAQGMFIGLTAGHARSHMIRSVMEGVVFCMYDNYKVIEETGFSTDVIVSSGGGARSQTFLQMEADIFQKSVKVADNNEQSCLGAAIVAAVGTKTYNNYEEACNNMVHWKNIEILPNPNNFAVYEHNYAIYKELYEANKILFHKNIKHGI